MGIKRGDAKVIKNAGNILVDHLKGLAGRRKCRIDFIHGFLQLSLLARLAD